MSARRKADTAEREAARRAREVTQRAIRRLDLLEWAIFGVGAILSAMGGAAVAWLLSTGSGWGFRSTWIGASFVLFVVAGVIAVARIKKDERADAARITGGWRNTMGEDDHG